MDEEDYDALRRKNIAERNEIFAEFFKDLKKQTSELKELDDKRQASIEDRENQPPRKRRRTIAGDTNSFKTKNISVGFRKTYNTRSKTKDALNNSTSNISGNESQLLPDTKRHKSKLRVLFPWAKTFQRDIDLMKMGVCDVDEEDADVSYDSDNHEEDDEYFTKKRNAIKITRSEYDPNNIPSVDEITDEMLENVAERSSLKEYCKVRGTSCHQCRQKTMDTKTVCRSGVCIGVRGQFCGPCLRGRYGESAVQALKDSNWVCPPCRGLCNCSICRTRSGLRPTGILAPVAQEEGFSSVMDYLQSAEINDT